MNPELANNGLTALASPRESDGVVEPYIGIDPADQQRAAVVATTPSEGRGLGRDVWCWRTVDAGRTWSGSRVAQAKFDGEGVADPLVAYGPDGELIAVAMTMPREYVDARIEQARNFTRLTAPTVEQRTRDHEADIQQDAYPASDMICVSRSEDHGRSWSSTVIPNSPAGDKTSLATDCGPNSPHRGNVYVAWWDSVNSNVAFARSVDAGRSFEPAVSIGPRLGFTPTQIAIGPSGVVHLVWTTALHMASNPEHPKAPTAVFHARSADGGRTFSAPAVAAEHSGAERVSMVSLAIAPNGSMLLALNETENPVVESGIQSRTSVSWSHTVDGERWTPLAPLTDLARDGAQGLPAVASSADAWHILTYDADNTSTTVRIYSAGHDDLEFLPTRDLARRAFGFNDIYLHGGYQLRSANDIALVGDYVGLAGVGSRLAAAIVLPQKDDWRSELTGYAGMFDAPG